MKTILVVDDYASVRFFHESLLKQAGFTTLAANNGTEALDLLGKNSVDLVLLDLLMPKMNGAEFIHCVRRLPRYAELPIFVVTSEPDGEQARALQGDPAIVVLSKPLPPTRMIEEVHRVLQS